MAELLTKMIIVFEFISFLASLTLYFRKPVSLYLKFFPFFLLITVVIEIIGAVYKFKQKWVTGMYNYFSVFEIVFYLFVLYHTIQNKNVKRIILYAGMLYPVIASINIYIQKASAFHSNTYSVGAILLVCLCVYYFYELFKKTSLTNPIHEPAFWLCFGLLIFYSCTLPLMGFINFMHRTKIELQVFALILSITNYLLYASFLIAFLCFFKFNNAENRVNIPKS